MASLPAVWRISPRWLSPGLVLGIALLLPQVPWGPALADEELEPPPLRSPEVTLDVEEGIEPPPCGIPRSDPGHRTGAG